MNDYVNYVNSIITNDYISGIVFILGGIWFLYHRFILKTWKKDDVNPAHYYCTPYFGLLGILVGIYILLITIFRDI